MASAREPPKRLFRQAAGIIEPTTGWYQPWYVEMRLEQEIERASRYGRPLSLISLRMAQSADPFSKGQHSQSVALGQLAMNGLRTSDLPGLLRADEYAIVLPETDRAGAETVGRRLHERLLPFGPIMRILSFPADGRSAQELLQGAMSVTR